MGLDWVNDKTFIKTITSAIWKMCVHNAVKIVPELDDLLTILRKWTNKRIFMTCFKHFVLMKSSHLAAIPLYYINHLSIGEKNQDVFLCQIGSCHLDYLGGGGRVELL